MGSILRRFSILSGGLVLAFVLTTLPAFAAAPAFVQANSNTTRTTTTSISVPFTSAQTAGNLNVVVVGWADTTSTVESVTDSDNNTYVLATGTNASTAGAPGVSQAIYYAKNIAGDTGSPANSVTVTFNQVPANEDVRILEYSGLDTTAPLDTTAGASGNGTAAASGSITTNSGTDLLIGAGTSANLFSAADPGYTQRTFPGGYGDIVEDQNVTVTGTYTATATVATAVNWAMQIVAFRAAGQTPPTFPAPGTLTLPSGNTAANTGGDPVTIDASNLLPGATVVFSNSSTSASAINCTLGSSSITCTTPVFPTGTADITVTNVDGQFSQLTGQFTFVAANPPQVASISKSAGATNGGTSVTISGSYFVAGATVTFGGVPADLVSVQNPSTITCNAPAHSAGAVDVVVKNPDGRYATLAGAFTYSPATGISFVQVSELVASSGSGPVDVPYTLAQTSGDTNIVVVSWADTVAQVQSVKDSAGNTYVPALNPVAANNLTQTIYYAKNIKASASNTVTVTFNGTATTPDVRVLEYRGLDVTNPLDTGTSNFSTTPGNVADSGNFTTAFANDLIIAAFTPSTTIASGGSGFITVNLPSSGDYIEHKITTAAGIQDAQATLKTSGSWIMQAVAFKATSAPPPAPSFTLSASPSSGSVTAGSSATYTLSVTPQNGFSAAVSLSCLAPSGVGITCSINPSSVTPNGGAANATLTVNTTGPTAALMAPGHNRNLLPLYAIWLPLPGIALAGVGLGSRRRKLGLGLACFLLIAFTLLLAGCGGGGSSTPPPPPPSGGTAAGNYSITVTATSASQPNQTATVTLTVQ